MDMALAQATKSHETTYTLDDAMDILLTKLDDAIHDMEAGRMQTIEEAYLTFQDPFLTLYICIGLLPSAFSL